MANETYHGPEEAWGIIWQAVGSVIVSPLFTEEIRNQVSQARSAVLNASQTPEQFDTTSTATGGPTFNDVTVGTKYMYDISAGSFSVLTGRICTVIKKRRTRIETTLDHDWGKFKQGHKLTVYPSHLRKL